MFHTQNIFYLYSSWDITYKKAKIQFFFEDAELKIKMPRQSALRRGSKGVRCAGQQSR
jgi:hypothetical protein